ncbi:MAG TPA: hypothetical protein PKD83_12960 [Ignavibacteria bacterium]|nr:hypothetical protein [Ignavibacteria bacterium]
MIRVREIFFLKFGKAKEARLLLKEGLDLMKKNNAPEVKVLTDFTGRSYRLIMESDHKDLADFEKTLKSELGVSEWQTWYQKFIPLVNSSEREILSLVEL